MKIRNSRRIRSKKTRHTRRKYTRYARRIQKGG